MFDFLGKNACASLVLLMMYFMCCHYIKIINHVHMCTLMCNETRWFKGRD